MIEKTFTFFENKKNLYRLIYFLLLAVLLPHTQWAFAKFEPNTTVGNITALLAAIFFELVIAVLTEKLADRISVKLRQRVNEVWYMFALRKFHFRYMNAYSFGLFIAWIVSTLANFGHAVEFGGELVIFSQYNVPFGLYALSFGAILPTASLIFASVLSSEEEVEQVDPMVEKLRMKVKGLEKEIKRLIGVIRSDEEEHKIAFGDLESRFANQIEELKKVIEEKESVIANLRSNSGKFVGLDSSVGKERMKVIYTIWPSLSNKVYSELSGLGASAVSENLKEFRSSVVSSNGANTE